MVRAVIVSGLLLACHSLEVTADQFVDIPPRVTIGGAPTGVVWEGWGTSLAWWTNVYGDTEYVNEELAEMFFTMNDSSFARNTAGVLKLPALGFNIARYNIGGSGSNVIDDSGTEIAMKTSKEMLGYKMMESFWLDWFNTDPKTKSWNWNADAKQRKMLSLAVGLGVNILEAYSSSPPWWMTKNRATAGGDKGDVDNLMASNIDQFALYLATVVSEAKTRWGVNFNYVEPFNEPSNKWDFPGTQEGCHFDVATQNEVVKRLRSHLDKLKLQSVNVSVSDENSPTQALTTLTGMTKTATGLGAVGKVNTHGNDGPAAYRGPDRAALKKLASDSSLKLWDSNYIDGDGSGLTLAQSIALDINELGVSAFVYDQVLNSGGLGLIQSNLWVNWTGEENPKYYVMAHYSRHIRPGMEMIGTDDVNTVAAYDSTNFILAIVRVNFGAEETKQMNLDDFVAALPTSVDKLPTRIDSWMTQMNSTDSFYVDSGIQSPSTVFDVVFPPESIATFQVHWALE
ncbi:hypothetical protein F441_14675 [Phytophthora nicotianae CJ01A1]|uniref:Endo-beta-1,6-galactanase-like domain-containing protein n=2 Tax=Phytophthora nicotianae TaxID=4792 RepID=W2WH57_PHYNI|nr:hypothetical protein L915_14420 [Phytophthora nicotianae]ETP09453.1 hypothetical protein F441_14675 [Phytophthora nicotianae CJ01A1]